MSRLASAVTFVKAAAGTDIKSQSQVLLSSLVLREKLYLKHGFVCAECNGPVSYKRAHVRSSHDVQEHFFHLQQDGTCSGGGESLLHTFCKNWICTNWSKLQFAYKCLRCQEEVWTYTPDKKLKEAVTEMKLPGAHSNSKYRIDVGTTDLAVEVWHTHAMEKDKAQAIKAAGMHLVELTTDKILQAMIHGRSKLHHTNMGVCKIKCNKCMQTDQNPWCTLHLQQQQQQQQLFPYSSTSAAISADERLYKSLLDLQASACFPSKLFAIERALRMGAKILPSSSADKLCIQILTGKFQEFRKNRLRQLLEYYCMPTTAEKSNLFCKQCRRYAGHASCTGKVLAWQQQQQ